MAAPADILVVDDEPDFRVIVGAILTRAGYAVRLACDGNQGVAAFRERRPDLVLLDVNMPELDGISACRLMRAEPGSRVPILMFTVRSHLTTAAESMSSGADDYILKPFEVDDLLARIARALGR